ncbi:MAG TPA: tripartite tricarboxylate transporter substrate binding protein [Xanthobacteraceae bacterium]
MAVAVAGALCLSGPVEAQSWPQRAIMLVVAFPPATTVDVAARAIAQDLTKTLGQPVVVENRPGGGGVIGTVSVVKAAPDGYTLLMARIGPAVLHPLVDHNLAYDPVADLTPVILVGDAVNVLAASPQRGWASVADVVAYAKQRGLTIGHSGPGTINHLLALLFSTEAGIWSTLISYQGSAPIVSDLAGGQIDTGFIAYGAGSRAARILAVATDERVDFLAYVPTLKEAGFPNVVGSTWNAIFAPAGLRAPIAARLNAAIGAFLAKDETRKRFDAVGYRILGGSPERLRAQMTDDRARWSKVVETAHISVSP